MNSFFKKLLKGGSNGFTMIELLVVIAVIGVLAVAVLSSINPIEQINKGRDTRTRSDAAQLINAVDRYFSIAEVYPWNTDNSSFWTATTTDPDDAFLHDGPGGDNWGWAQILVANAEVKDGFYNRLDDDDSIYVAKEDSSNATMYACFQPASNAFQQEAAINCDQTSGGRTTPNISSYPGAAGDVFCTTTDGTTDEDNYICLP
jgi:prepilin-type N-terminal cleavage/methylation domain-containing protein